MSDARMDILRHRITVALDVSMVKCARCKVCDAQVDAVMAVLEADQDEVAEWGVRFTLAGSRAESACPDEDKARRAVAAMRENHPDWDAVLVRRPAVRLAGPWTEVPGE